MARSEGEPDSDKPLIQPFIIQMSATHFIDQQIHHAPDSRSLTSLCGTMIAPPTGFCSVRNFATAKHGVQK